MLYRPDPVSMIVVRPGTIQMADFDFYSDHPRAGLKVDQYVSFLERTLQLQIIPEGPDGEPTEHQLEILRCVLRLNKQFVSQLNESARLYLTSIQKPEALEGFEFSYQIYGIQIFGWQNPPVRSFGVFAACERDPSGYIEWIVQDEEPIFCGPNEFHWGEGKPEDIESLKSSFLRLSSN